MEQCLKELKEQLQSLAIGENETKRMRAESSNTELKILLNDTLETIEEHKGYLEEKIINLINKQKQCSKIEEKTLKRLNQCSFQYINEDKRIADRTIKEIELAIELIDKSFKWNMIKNEDCLILKEIKNRYNYIDSELENYILRIDNGEI